ncbi:hypothetical protein BRAS3843_1480033 [Bradyrhizobium sp. STM 3843]|uniref:hypothetical protein n=1 Tax=Bradyrhizobium sp. STM 3843 TaxID=551947 RepID=UPI0002406BAC|nr:hypothetical protein [Bradyrhizobium sp. STM 3843]CCE05802.1 hypothetical protein BRAS3843_1480033 [Bradyrhizobium sp. STM 3843]
MTDLHPTFGRNCMECRIREALRADGAPPSEDGSIPVLSDQALEVLCKVAGEILAHHPPEDAKAFYFNVLEYIKRWKKTPLVMAQQEPLGRA